MHVESKAVDQGSKEHSCPVFLEVSQDTVCIYKPHFKVITPQLPVCNLKFDIPHKAIQCTRSGKMLNVVYAINHLGVRSVPSLGYLPVQAIRICTTLVSIVLCGAFLQNHATMQGFDQIKIKL